MFYVLRPSLVADLVEDVGELQRRPDGLEHRVDLVRCRSLRVPDDANADHLRAVQQSAANSDFGATRVLRREMIGLEGDRWGSRTVLVAVLLLIDKRVQEHGGFFKSHEQWHSFDGERHWHIFTEQLQ